MKKSILALLVVIAAIGVSLFVAVISTNNTIIPPTSGNNTPGNTSQGTGTNDTNNNLPGITLQELAKHNSRSDCWVLYKGSVYDITSFLPNHPGSAGAISPYCGNTGFEAAFIAQHGTRKASLFLQIAKLMGNFNQQGALTG